MPEQVGAYWSGQRRRAVVLDITGASRRYKHLLNGEAKWGDKAVPDDVLADLIGRSRLMPSVEAGWQTNSVLFSRSGFTEAKRAAARDQDGRLVDLAELARTLFQAT